MAKATAPEQPLHSWEQWVHEGESAVEFRAFGYYMRLAPETRSVKAALRNIRNQWKTAPWTQLKSLEDVATRRHWVYRANAFDNYLIGRREAASRSALISAAVRQARAASLSADIVEMGLKRHLKAMRKDKAEKPGIRDLKDLYWVSVQVRRLEQGQPLSISESTVTRTDLRKKMDEVLKRMDASAASATGKAAAAESTGEVAH